MVMSKKIKLLISPRNLKEAEITINSGVDYIDCKNPDEGSLGANFPWIIKQMKKMINDREKQLLSATIGDFPNLPGSASLAALGAAISGADIIKVGLKGPMNESQGIYLMKNVVKAVKEYDDSIKVVAAGYADYTRMNSSLSYLSIPKVAAESGSDIAMLDTFIKDGKELFDFLSIDNLVEFVKQSKQQGLGVALAGNLKLESLPKIKQISPDIIGVRSVVCEGYDRTNGTIQDYLIQRLQDELYR